MGIRNHRCKHAVISFREFTGADSVAAEKLSKKTLALELSAGPRFQVVNVMKTKFTVFKLPGDQLSKGFGVFCVSEALQNTEKCPNFNCLQYLF